MSETKPIESVGPDDRRAVHVAGLGLLIQTFLSGVLIALAVWKESDAIAAAARLMVVGVPIWLILYLIFKQMRRVASESLETAELKRRREAGESDTIFELDDEALLLEQNRLRWMVKWMMPAVTVVCAGFLLLGQLLGWDWALDNAFGPEGVQATKEPTLMMWFVVAVGFICFLFARYSIALAKIPQWRVIRAGATILAGNALACLGLALALMATGTIPWAEPVFAYLLRIVLVVLGLEFAMNFILDLYRPRSPGEIPRPSFDSRLLGLITEPGGIAKSIADAINYQFGFEVSGTWFYQLLQRWLLPIMVVTIVAVLLLSSIVIVDADEKVVIEHFGRRIQEPPEALEPGLHLKWPWPIDEAVRAPVRRVGELVIGEKTGEDDEHRAIIWTEQHEYVPELMLLVASRKSESLAGNREIKISDSLESESSPVSLLMVSVPIEYRIKNIHQYLYNHADPVEVLEAVGYQLLSDYAAGIDMDELMGPGRERFNAELTSRIQERLDDLEVGIEIVFAGVRGAHPPAKDKVADAFQAVIRAETDRTATISAAQGLARKILTRAAGTESRAQELDEAIKAHNRLQKEAEPGSDELIAARRRVSTLLEGDPTRGIEPVSGEAAAIIANSRAHASARISEAHSKVRAFDAAVAAYQAAPGIYMKRKWLEVYENMGNIRRFLLAGDASNVTIVYEPRKEAGLDKVLADTVEKEREAGQ